jgi:hypothetical protein
MKIGAGAPRRPEQVEMRRAGFVGDHSPRDKERHLASRKCRRESTPQTHADGRWNRHSCTRTDTVKFTSRILEG